MFRVTEMGGTEEFFADADALEADLLHSATDSYRATVMLWARDSTEEVLYVSNGGELFIDFWQRLPDDE